MIIFFWLKFWLFGGLAETSLNQFAHPLTNILSKLLCTKTRIAQPPKQVHKSPRWHMEDKGQIYFCLEKILFLF